MTYREANCDSELDARYLARTFMIVYAVRCGAIDCGEVVDKAMETFAEEEISWGSADRIIDFIRAESIKQQEAQS